MLLSKDTVKFYIYKYNLLARSTKLMTLNNKVNKRFMIIMNTCMYINTWNKERIKLNFMSLLRNHQSDKDFWTYLSYSNHTKIPSNHSSSYPIKLLILISWCLPLRFKLNLIQSIIQICKSTQVDIISFQSTEISYNIYNYNILELNGFHSNTINKFKLKSYKIQVVSIC